MEEKKINLNLARSLLLKPLRVTSEAYLGSLLFFMKYYLFYYGCILGCVSVLPFDEEYVLTFPNGYGRYVYWDTCGMNQNEHNWALGTSYFYSGHSCPKALSFLLRIAYSTNARVSPAWNYAHFPHIKAH